jgi:hypothetical protein
MRWAIFWICLCATITLIPVTSYGHDSLQYLVNTQAAPLSGCAEDNALTRSYVDRVTQDWSSYLRVDDDWRAQCRALYTQCKNQNWGFKKGWDCHECFRNCEGQQEWPFHLCGPSIKKTQPKPTPRRRRR